MKVLLAIALGLALLGAVNWGLVGLLGVDLVAALFGAGTEFARAVYIVIGLAGLAAIPLFGRLGDRTPARREPTLQERDPAFESGKRAPLTATRPRAEEMSAGRTHTTRAPAADLPRDRADAPVADDAAVGTTHDPNSVTTGTEVEPDGDVFPPRGEREAPKDARRLN
jgi:uncharacterized membrane protein YuzA (DUF378 family)